MHPGDELAASSEDGAVRTEEQLASTQTVPIRRVPCDGPGCRQAPANPPVPPATPQVDSKWITWSERCVPRSGEVLLYELQDSAGCALDGFSPTIERPPKS